MIPLGIFSVSKMYAISQGEIMFCRDQGFCPAVGALINLLKECASASVLYVLTLKAEAITVLADSFCRKKAGGGESYYLPLLSCM